MLKALTALALLSLFTASPSLAASMTDRNGEIICGAGACGRDQRGDVYCSPWRFGSAFRTRDGWIYCGRGQCTTNRQGQYLCSDVEGGAIVRLSDGSVRCEGNCEPASWELCERVPAGR